MIKSCYWSQIKSLSSGGQESLRLSQHSDNLPIWCVWYCTKTTSGWAKRIWWERRQRLCERTSFQCILPVPYLQEKLRLLLPEHLGITSDEGSCHWHPEMVLRSCYLRIPRVYLLCLNWEININKEPYITLRG